jgi:hypothetical protein
MEIISDQGASRLRFSSYLLFRLKLVKRTAQVVPGLRPCESGEVVTIRNPRTIHYWIGFSSDGGISSR